MSYHPSFRRRTSRPVCHSREACPRANGERESTVVGAFRETPATCLCEKSFRRRTTCPRSPVSLRGVQRRSNLSREANVIPAKAGIQSPMSYGLSAINYEPSAMSYQPSLPACHPAPPSQQALVSKLRLGGIMSPRNGSMQPFRSKNKGGQAK